MAAKAKTAKRAAKSAKAKKSVSVKDLAARKSVKGGGTLVRKKTFE